jgi:alkanesulfonate monooxygenase SsuD/methylene tetrahydromethanopterin reductase-like flavin-dependent oxidoreductase (luciferase family)
MVNPWVVPIQKPHPAIWFPGTGSPESVIWAAQHQYPYMNLGALLDLTIQLKSIYQETAHEMGYEPGPQHFGYLMRIFCADTDEQAYEMGKTFLWTQAHRQRGPVEFNDPPGYQSREALRIKMTRPTLGTGTIGRQLSYDELQAAYNIVVGSPETVIKKLRHVRKELNPGYILVYGNEGNMPHEAVMRSVELLGTKVIPAIKEDL